MSRRLAALLAMVLLALAGCGTGVSPRGRAAAAGPQDALAHIRASGILRVAVSRDMPPLGFLRPGTDRPEGLQADLARALAAGLLGAGGRVDLVPVTSANRLVALDAGAADVVLAGVTPTPALAGRYHLSPPYYRTAVMLIGRRNGPALDRLRALDGHRVAVIQGSPAGEAVIAAAASRKVTAVLHPEPDAATAIADVQSGEVVGLAIGQALVPDWLRQDPRLRAWRPPAGSFEYVAVTAAGQPALAEAVDAVIRDLVGGATWRALLRKWRLAVPRT